MIEEVVPGERVIFRKVVFFNMHFRHGREIKIGDVGDIFFVEKIAERRVDEISLTGPVRDDKEILGTGEGDVEETHEIEIAHAV